MKRSLFNGYVNKLKVNFGKLQSSILMNLFNSYCCSFYGSRHICGNIVQIHLINVVKRGILLYVTCYIYHIMRIHGFLDQSIILFIRCLD